MRSAEEGREEVVVKGPLLELWGDVTNGGYDGWMNGGGNEGGRGNQREEEGKRACLCRSNDVLDR